MEITDFHKENNFRELGGYTTQDGRKVKHGMFYRCGALGSLNEEELKAVEQLGIHSIFDFRSNDEIEKLADPDIPGARYYHVSAITDEEGNEVNLSPEEMESMSEEERYSEKAQSQFLENFYGLMVFSPAYKVMFREIQNGKTPILFHCSAGKDRTGIAGILILLALGVDEKTALEDYMKTNEYRKTLIDQFLSSQKEIIEKYPHAKKLFNGFEGVNIESAQFALQKIKERYGDYGTYFKERYHLGPEELGYLRSKYTEE